MEYNNAALECAAMAMRADMWQTVCRDAIAGRGSEDDAGGQTRVGGAAGAGGVRFPAWSLFFALPIQERWRTYTAELEGEVVSFGSMLLHEGVAWVGLDATVEDARGRGCHRVLL